MVVQVASPVDPSQTIQVPINVTYIVLELADGCLADLVVSIDELKFSERLALFRDIAKGVHQMHLKRVVNRDLKSDNVLLFEEAGLVTTAKITDLGRGRKVDVAPIHVLEEYAIGRGDLRFAPPEMLWWQGTASLGYWSAVDLYHLGSIFFELVIGSGLTSVALPDALAIVNQNATLPHDARRAAYIGSTAALRGQMELAWEMFDSALPVAIRLPASALLRQLTDPDPSLRSPKVFGQPMPPHQGLQWLLRRIDILRLSLARAESQATALARSRRMRSLSDTRNG